MEKKELDIKIWEFRNHVRQTYASLEEQKKVFQNINMALKGDPHAMLFIGERISCFDQALSCYWIEKAAYEKDLPEAYYSLANCYFWGCGVEKDFDIVFELIEKAIQKGCKSWNSFLCYYLEEVNPERVVPYYLHGYSEGEAELKYQAASRLCAIYSGILYPQLRNREKYYYWLNLLRKSRPDYYDYPDFFNDPDFFDHQPRKYKFFFIGNEI